MSMQHDTNDHYEVLGVARDASASAIKRAYLALIQKSTPESAPEAFRRYTEAYQTLSNPQKRAEYDATERVPAPLKLRIAAIMEEHEGDDETIASELSDLIDDWPNVRFLRELAGIHYIQAEEFEEACEILGGLCDLEPDNASHLTLFARALQGADRSDEAERNLKAALVADANYAPAYLALSEHYLDIGQVQQALDLLDRGVKADGKLDAADLPLLIRILLLEARELMWDKLKSTTDMLRRLVPSEDTDARRYIASQLAQLIEPYADAERPDMLHLIFALIADLDPANTAAREQRDELAEAAAAWRERVELMKSTAQPDWLKALVFSVHGPSDDARHKRILVNLLDHVTQNLSSATSDWNRFKSAYPALASSVADRWHRFEEFAKKTQSTMQRSQNRAAPQTTANNAGCLTLLVSAIMIAGGLLMFFLTL